MENKPEQTSQGSRGCGRRPVGRRGRELTQDAGPHARVPDVHRFVTKAVGLRTTGSTTLGDHERETGEAQS